MKKETKGTKHDQGKPQIHLVPTEAIEAAARALGFGAIKYDRWNYRGGITHTRLYDSVMRHMMEYLSGRSVDPESGLDPLDHAIAALSMLIWMRKHRPDLDDRYKEQDGK